MPHIYDCISKDHPDDATLKTQYKALRNKTQQDLGVQANYIDPSLLPYNDAVQKLREISVVRLPTQKLRSVILASQSALKRMSELCTEEEVVPGAGKEFFSSFFSYGYFATNSRVIFNFSIYVFAVP